MGQLEEMLVRNGLVLRQPDGSTSYLDGSLCSNSLCIRNSSGWVTHRIKLASNGVDLIVVNESTGFVEQNLKLTSSNLFF